MSDTRWQGTICPACDQLMLPGYIHHCPAVGNVNVGELLAENRELFEQLGEARGRLVAADTEIERLRLILSMPT